MGQWEGERERGEGERDEKWMDGGRERESIIQIGFSKNVQRFLHNHTWRRKNTIYGRGNRGERNEIK